MNSESTLIGKRIREVRLAKGLKQTALNDLAELPINSVCKIERGHREPSTPELLRIARALSTTIDFLTNASSTFVCTEEIKVIEALRVLKYEDYKRIIRTIEAQIYFDAKDVGDSRKHYIHGLVSELTRLSSTDLRPRSHIEEQKRIK